MDAQKIGPLLNRAIARMAEAESRGMVELAAAHAGSLTDDERLPVVIQLPPTKPENKEAWSNYRSRIMNVLGEMTHVVHKKAGVETVPLIAGNALRANASTRQLDILSEISGIRVLELDPLLQVAQMDDAVEDVQLEVYRQRHPMANDGSGVTVAVLDSGIDDQHPALNVADSVSTSGESVAIPGSHGTHCAGSIASRDQEFPGIAPGVRLLSVKVLRANGSGTHSGVVQGIDAALDRDAHVLSMSLGFNHLPTWSQGGHGWSCPDGRCVLCTAVDNASLLDNVVVVVAAGNEHERAVALRRPRSWWTSFLDWILNRSPTLPFDTELGCPGQAREAITVGALTKRTFQPAVFSSHGPTAYGIAKPDLSAPGVNITSTIPMPRDAMGIVLANSPRALQFGRKSGTSMATPIVSGAVALVIQQQMQSGTTWTPASIKRILQTNGVNPLGFPAMIVGAGHLTLNRL